MYKEELLLYPKFHDMSITKMVFCVRISTFFVQYHSFYCFVFLSKIKIFRIIYDFFCLNLGRQEDLEDMRREEAENKRKKMKMKGR